MITKEQRERSLFYSKKWQREHPGARNKYMQRWNKLRSTSLKDIWNEFFKDPTYLFCAECGGPGETFHHIDPTTRRFSIGFHTFKDMCLTEAGWELFMEEISYTVLLCRTCHGRKHRKQ